MIEDDELWREFEALFDAYPEEVRALLTTEVVQRVVRAGKRRLRKNVRAREKRQWLKTAPREDTALRYRGKPEPCSIAQYLFAERVVLRYLEEHPGKRPDALMYLLWMAHLVLHLLHPEEVCKGATI